MKNNIKHFFASLSIEKTAKLGEYAWSLIRLAELYLNYTKACVECYDLGKAKIYLNKVRYRTGVPDVEVSWDKMPGTVLYQTKTHQIVHRERQFKLYLENYNVRNFSHRKEAEALSKKPRTLTINEQNLAKFGKRFYFLVPTVHNGSDVKNLSLAE